MDYHAGENRGGVQNLIKTIESGAAKKALKETGQIGVGVGVLVGAGAMKGFDAGKNAWSKYKQSQGDAAEAKEQLKAIVKESLNTEQRPADSPDDIRDET